MQDILLSQCLSSPRCIDQVPAQTDKNIRVGRLFTENNGTESVIAIMIILIDLCSRNKQTNCNLLLSKGFTSEKREETLWHYSVERKKSHTKQSKPDFAVPG